MTTKQPKGHIVDYVPPEDEGDPGAELGEKVMVGDRSHRLVRRRDLPVVIGMSVKNPDDFVVLPDHTEDDEQKLEFPKDMPLYDAGWAVSRGISYHRIDRWTGEFGESPLHPDQKVRVVTYDPTKLAGFTARKITFDELDLDFECREVLMAHGWITSAHTQSPELRAKVLAIEPKAEEYGRRHWRDNWEAYIVERATELLAEPLSRLWYAGSMFALYYSGDNEFLLGYLWAEYQAKLRYEHAAFSHLQNLSTARANGRTGGRRKEKRERYETLDRLFHSHRHELPALPERDDYVKLIKRLAEQHDRKTGQGLFRNDQDRAFSIDYYRDWYSDFRQRSSLHGA